MKSISINGDLLSILEDYSNFFFNRDYSKLESYISKNKRYDKIKIKEKNDEAVSDQYLETALLGKPYVYAFPLHSWGLELVYDRNYIDDPELIKKCNYTNSKLINFFGAKDNALQMYYPPGGYIGWHNNCNASGYNIILTCNPKGDGYFKHYDHVNDKYNVFPDEKGWSCKVGYFGTDKEHDKIFWHCARTQTPRLTFSYIIYDKNVWDDMVDDIGYVKS